MKLSDTRAFDDTKCVISKMDLKCRWCVKSVDSCLLNVYHKNISDHRRDARSHWCLKNLPIQRLHKLRSFDNRSKLRILVSLIGTDMNKLTTSNDTLHSPGLTLLLGRAFCQNVFRKGSILEKGKRKSNPS